MNFLKSFCPCYCSYYQSGQLFWNTFPGKLLNRFSWSWIHLKGVFKIYWKVNCIPNVKSVTAASCFAFCFTQMFSPSFQTCYFLVRLTYEIVDWNFYWWFKGKKLLYWRQFVNIFSFTSWTALLLSIKSTFNQHLCSTKCDRTASLLFHTCRSSAIWNLQKFVLWSATLTFCLL